LSEAESITWLIVALAAVAAPAIVYVRLEEQNFGTPARLSFAGLAGGAVLLLGSGIAGMVDMVDDPAPTAAAGAAAGTYEPATAGYGEVQPHRYGKTESPDGRSESALRTGPPEESREHGAWRVSTERNPVDNAPLLFLSVNAVSGQMPNGATPSFHARCKSRKPEAYVVWGSFVGDDGNGANWKDITLRIGQQRAEHQRWPVSTDKEATFAPSHAGTLLRRLDGEERLTIQMKTHRAVPITAVFPLQGFHEALKELKAGCNL